MKKITILVFFTSLLTSCATLVSDNYQKINVYAENKEAVLLYEGTQKKLPTSLLVPKSKEEIELAYIQNKDTLREFVPRGLSGKYVVGNFFLCPIVGHLLDLSNNRMYKFSENVVLPEEQATSFSRRDFRKRQRQLLEKHSEFIEETPVFLSETEEKKYKKHIMPEEGDVLRTIYLPSLQYINIQSSGHKVETFGWISLGFGVEKYYKKNRSWRISLLYKYTGILPLTGPRRFISYDETGFLSSTYRVNQTQLLLEKNYKLNQRYEASLGGQLSYNSLNFVYYSDEKVIDDRLFSRVYNLTTDRYFSLGFSAKISRRIGGRYYLSLQHQPNLLNFTNYGTIFHYQPNTSLGISYKL